MYKELKRLECFGMLDVLLQKGIIPCNIKRHKIIYEVFLTQKKEGEKTSQAVTNISEDFDISEVSLYRIIRKMR